MPRSHWTLLVIPDDNQRVTSLRISSATVRTILSLSLVAFLLLGSISVALLVKQNHQLRSDRLAQENLLLAAEVDQMREQVAQLSESIDILSAKDQKYRTIAGLLAIDPEVRRVGIGGPGTSTLEGSALYQANPELGEKVYGTSYDLATLLRRASLLRSSMDEALTTLEKNTEKLAATPSIIPSTGYLSSLFSRNRRHPVLKVTRPHEGIDIAAPVGTPIVAPAKGRVVFAGMKSGGYGNTVEIDHGHGHLTRFAHASRILVRNGEMVERGQIIAEVGATGLVSGPHLHYEVEVNGKAVDPLNYILTDVLPD